MKMIVAICAKYKNLLDQYKPIALLLLGFLSLLSIIFLFKACQAIPFSQHKTVLEPMMIYEGNRIKIPEHSPLRTQLSIKTATQSSVPHIISVPGVIEADPARIINVLPPLTGRIMSLNVNLGEHVKKNQVLAVISSPDLGSAYTDNEKAIGLLKLTTEALKRARAVQLAGGASIKMVQQAENDYMQAVAESKRTEARLKTLGNNTFNVLTIRSPISGCVTGLNYGEGAYINDSTASLMTISNLDPIWVTASVPENFVRAVAKDQLVEVRMLAYPKEHLHGKISFVSSFLEPDTHRNKTRIVFANPNGKLQPNMFATIHITVSKPNQIMIPLSAVLMNNDTTSVYVETSPWCFESRAVQLGSEDGELVRVLSGLTPGERIVEMGGIFIND